MNRFGLIVVVWLVVTGCSSIPVSTMLRMSSMDESTLQEIQPAELRARISLLPEVSPNLEKTRLQISLTTPQGERQFTFPLQAELHQSVVIEGGLFSDDVLMTAHTLRLTESGIVAFKEMQDTFAKHDVDELGLSVQVRLNKPDDHEKGVMNVELQLSANEDYLTLVDNYHYTVGEQRQF